MKDKRRVTFFSPYLFAKETPRAAAHQQMNENIDLSADYADFADYLFFSLCVLCVSVVYLHRRSDAHKNHYI